MYTASGAFCSHPSPPPVRCCVELTVCSVRGHCRAVYSRETVCSPMLGSDAWDGGFEQSVEDVEVSQRGAAPGHVLHSMRTRWQSLPFEASDSGAGVSVERTVSGQEGVLTRRQPRRFRPALIADCGSSRRAGGEGGTAETRNIFARVPTHVVATAARSAPSPTAGGRRTSSARQVGPKAGRTHTRDARSRLWGRVCARRRGIYTCARGQTPEPRRPQVKRH